MEIMKTFCLAADVELPTTRQSIERQTVLCTQFKKKKLSLHYVKRQKHIMDLLNSFVHFHSCAVTRYGHRQLYVEEVEKKLPTKILSY